MAATQPSDRQQGMPGGTSFPSAYDERTSDTFTRASGRVQRLQTDAAAAGREDWRFGTGDRRT